MPELRKKGYPHQTTKLVTALLLAGLALTTAGVTSELPDSASAKNHLHLSNWDAAAINTASLRAQRTGDKIGSFTIQRPIGEALLSGIQNDWGTAVSSAASFSRLSAAARRAALDRALKNENVDLSQYLTTTESELRNTFTTGTADRLSEALSAAAENAVGAHSAVRKIEVDYTSGVGDRRWQAGASAVGALRETPEDIIAWQLRGYAAEDFSAGANAGLIYRRQTNIANQTALTGINTFIDYETHGDSNENFLRWSWGWELRTEHIDLFFNQYVPITDAQTKGDSTYYTQEGHDVELALKASDRLSAGLTHYRWNGEHGDKDDTGIRYNIRIAPFTSHPLLHQIKLAVELDSPESGDLGWGGQLAYSYRLGAPLSGVAAADTSEDSAFIPRDHFYDPVRREYAQRIKRTQRAGGGGGGGGGAVGNSSGQIRAIALTNGGDSTLHATHATLTTAITTTLYAAASITTAHNPAHTISISTDPAVSGGTDALALSRADSWKITARGNTKLQLQNNAATLNLITGTIHLIRYDNSSPATNINVIHTPILTIHLIGTTIQVGHSTPSAASHIAMHSGTIAVYAGSAANASIDLHGGKVHFHLVGGVGGAVGDADIVSCQNTEEIINAALYNIRLHCGNIATVTHLTPGAAARIAVADDLITLTASADGTIHNRNRPHPHGYPLLIRSSDESDNNIDSQINLTPAIDAAEATISITYKSKAIAAAGASPHLIIPPAGAQQPTLYITLLLRSGRLTGLDSTLNCAANPIIPFAQTTPQPIITAISACNQLSIEPATPGATNHHITRPNDPRHITYIQTGGNSDTTHTLIRISPADPTPNILQITSGSANPLTLRLSGSTPAQQIYRLISQPQNPLVENHVGAATLTITAQIVAAFTAHPTTNLTGSALSGIEQGMATLAGGKLPTPIPVLTIRLAGALGSISSAQLSSTHPGLTLAAAAPPDDQLIIHHAAILPAAITRHTIRIKAADSGIAPDDGTQATLTLTAIITAVPPRPISISASTRSAITYRTPSSDLLTIIASGGGFDLADTDYSYQKPSPMPNDLGLLVSQQHNSHAVLYLANPQPTAVTNTFAITIADTHPATDHATVHLTVVLADPLTLAATSYSAGNVRTDLGTTPVATISVSGGIDVNNTGYNYTLHLTPPAIATVTPPAIYMQTSGGYATLHIREYITHSTAITVSVHITDDRSGVSYHVSLTPYSPTFTLTETASTTTIHHTYTNIFRDLGQENVAQGGQGAYTYSITAVTSSGNALGIGDFTINNSGQIHLNTPAAPQTATAHIAITDTHSNHSQTYTLIIDLTASELQYSAAAATATIRTTDFGAIATLSAALTSAGPIADIDIEHNTGVITPATLSSAVSINTSTGELHLSAAMANTPTPATIIIEHIATTPHILGIIATATLQLTRIPPIAIIDAHNTATIITEATMEVAQIAAENAAIGDSGYTYRLLSTITALTLEKQNIPGVLTATLHLIQQLDTPQTITAHIAATDPIFADTATATIIIHARHPNPLTLTTVGGIQSNIALSTTAQLALLTVSGGYLNTPNEPAQTDYPISIAPAGTLTLTATPSGHIAINLATPLTVAATLTYTLTADDHHSQTPPVHLTLTLIAATAPAAPDTSTAAIYLIAGKQTSNDHPQTDDILHYTPATGWATLVASGALGQNTEIIDHNAASYRGSIYIAGIHNHETEQDTNQVWASQDGTTWHQRTAAAQWTPRSGAPFLVHHNHLIIIGGSEGSTEIWKTQNGANWQLHTDNAPHLYNHAAAIHNNTIYTTAGSHYAGDTMWKSADGINWQQIPNTPFVGINPQLISYQNKLHLIGGSSAYSALTSTPSPTDGTILPHFTSEDNGQTWQRHEITGTDLGARGQAAAVIHNNTLYYIGGRKTTDEQNFAYAAGIIATGDGQNWTQQTSLPAPRRRFAALSHNPANITDPQDPPALTATLTLLAGGSNHPITLAAAPAASEEITIAQITPTGGVLPHTHTLVSATPHHSINITTGIITTNPTAARAHALTTALTIHANPTAATLTTALTITTKDANPYTPNIAHTLTAIILPPITPHAPDNLNITDAKTGAIATISASGGAASAPNTPITYTYALLSGTPAAYTLITNPDQNNTILSLTSKRPAGTETITINITDTHQTTPATQHPITISIHQNLTISVHQYLHTLHAHHSNQYIATLTYQHGQSDNATRTIAIAQAPANITLITTAANQGALLKLTTPTETDPQTAIIIITAQDQQQNSVPVTTRLTLAIHTTPGQGSAHLYGVHNNGNFNQHWHSPDGINWTLRSNQYITPYRADSAGGHHNSKLWKIGGYENGSSTNPINEVWHSANNGKTWQKTTQTQGKQLPPFAAGTFLSHNNQILILGTQTGEPNRIYNNHVWSSADGANWTLQTDTAPFAGTPTAISHNNTIWIIGGYTNIGDATANTDHFFSADNGKTWTTVTTGNLPATSGKTGAGVLIAHNSTLWHFGGMTDILTSHKETWNSTNGKNWTQQTNFPINIGLPTAITHQGKIHLLGGFGDGYLAARNTIIWTSANGTNWTNSGTIHITFQRDKMIAVGATPSQPSQPAANNPLALTYPAHPTGTAKLTLTTYSKLTQPILTITATRGIPPYTHTITDTSPEFALTGADGNVLSISATHTKSGAHTLTIQTTETSPNQQTGNLTISITIHYKPISISTHNHWPHIAAGANIILADITLQTPSGYTLTLLGHSGGNNSTIQLIPHPTKPNTHQLTAANAQPDPDGKLRATLQYSHHILPAPVTSVYTLQTHQQGPDYTPPYIIQHNAPQQNIIAAHHSGKLATITITGGGNSGIDSGSGSHSYTHILINAPSAYTLIGGAGQGTSIALLTLTAPRPLGTDIITIQTADQNPHTPDSRHTLTIHIKPNIQLGILPYYGDSQAAPAVETGQTTTIAKLQPTHTAGQITYTTNHPDKLTINSGFNGVQLHLTATIANPTNITITLTAQDQTTGSHPATAAYTLKIRSKTQWYGNHYHYGPATGEQLLNTWHSTDGTNWSKIATKYLPYLVRPAGGAHNNTLWQIGGMTQPDNTLQNQTWHSTDGKNWQQITLTQGKQLPPTRDAVFLSHNNNIILLGGISKRPDADASAPQSNVWISSDGASWTQQTDSAPFTGHPSAIIVSGTIWIIGGSRDAHGAVPSSTHAYSTDSGKTWTTITAGNLPTETGIIAAAALTYHKGTIWQTGGKTQTIGGRTNQIWHSTDGANWTKAAETLPHKLQHHITQSTGAKIHLYHGSISDSQTNNQIWTSTDGLNWTAEPTTPPPADLIGRALQAQFPDEVPLLP